MNKNIVNDPAILVCLIVLLFSLFEERLWRGQPVATLEAGRFNCQSIRRFGRACYYLIRPKEAMVLEKPSEASFHYQAHTLQLLPHIS